MCQLTATPLTQKPLSPLPIPDLSNTVKKHTSRLKVWEVSSHYYCAALGTCLTLKELRQIGKKASIEGISTWTDYEMHVFFIHALNEKCYVSIQVNKLLDKKYKINILHFSKTKTEEDRIVLWNKAIASGDIAGAFWALLTHPNTVDNTLFQVYGKVHMLSHLSGATARIDMREFHQLEQRNQELESQIKKNKKVVKKKFDKKETYIKQLKTQLATAQSEKKVLQTAQQELEKIKHSPLVESLQHRLNQLTIDFNNAVTRSVRAEASAQNWKQHATREQQQKQTLEQQLNDLSEEKLSIENILSQLLAKQQTDKSDCATCPNSNPDLCGRCVLYIGGRTGQYSHFRQLVEQQNGQFIHHDGGREDGHQKLASIVSKADVVLCPLDCVSHNAMNAVKRHCQNNTKQLVFIPHASLSAFSKGLSEVIN